MGIAVMHPVPERVKQSFVIFDIRALWRSTLNVRVPWCQKSKITNDGLTRSGTGCFIRCSCTNMATVGVNGLKFEWRILCYVGWLAFRLQFAESVA